VHLVCAFAPTWRRREFTEIFCAVCVCLRRAQFVIRFSNEQSGRPRRIWRGRCHAARYGCICQSACCNRQWQWTAESWICRRRDAKANISFIVRHTRQYQTRKGVPTANLHLHLHLDARSLLSLSPRLLARKPSLKPVLKGLVILAVHVLLSYL
jgi:hypothetical protein